jgi:GDPmannose 4,6-dehydratase
MPKTAIICGISGQDGAYLAKLLLSKGYIVVGTSRDSTITPMNNLHRLGIFDSVKVLSMASGDFGSVQNVIRNVNPDEIYYLAGQSSVGLSFDQPIEVMQSVAMSALNILEAIKFLGKSIKFYNAGTGECYGNCLDEPASELTPFNPQSPYAIAKVTAYHLVENYRLAYGLFACTGILFNHESPLRPERFVSQKVVSAAFRISQGSKERLKFGNLNISRDWGYAPDYVEAMWLMLQASIPQDFVIATGVSISLQDFVSRIFSFFNLDWQNHVDLDHGLLRPLDIMCSKANPNKANNFLNWRAATNVDDLIAHMCKAHFKR